MIDSTAIQEILKDTTATGFMFVPENYKFLLPLFSTALTAIGAALIRYYERSELMDAHEREKTQILKDYLNADTPALEEKLNQLKNKDEKL